MLNYLVTENAPGLELLLVLTVGTAVMVGLAALADRLVRSAIWQRTIWQVTIFGVLALVLVELTGTGPALVGLWRARTSTEAQSTQLGRVAGVDGHRREALVGEPPGPSVSGGSLTLDPGHPESDQPDLAPAIDFAWLDDADSVSAPRATGGLLASAERVAGVDGHRREALVGEPPDLRISGGSLTLDRGHLESGQPLGQASRWLGLIWALGAVVIAARTVCARALLFAFWRRGTRLSDGPLCERAVGLARRLGIRRRVYVLEAVGLSAPVAFGGFRPAVALPATFAEEFDRQQQDAVLAHELAHLAARDPAWQVVAGLLCAALWWHPLVWWSRHRLRAASEAAADEASLLVPDGPDVLAQCLVAMGWRLARVPSGWRQLGWVSFEGPGFRSSLGRRVERLLNLRARPWRAPGRGRLAFAKATLPVAFLIVAVSCTAWARSQAPLTEGGTTMSVLRVSWRHSLAAAMLLAFVSPASGDAVADDPPADQSLPVVAGGDLAGAQVQLALLADGQEREKGEAREREEGEREKGEAREGKEREREEGEAREGKEREREEGEAREGEKRERKEDEAREREGGERREADAGRDRLAQELGKLEEKARDIRRRLEGLRDGQDAEARELQGALREVERRMEAIRRELRGPEREGEPREPGERERAELQGRLRTLEQKRQALSDQAAAIQRALEGLRRDDQAEQARKHREKLAEVRAAIERLQGEIRERSQQLGRPREGADRPRPDREQLARRLDELKAAVGRLAEAGKRDEAEAKEREVREIIRLLEGRAEPPVPPGPPADVERRIGHLKVAIENLRAAGLHDQAEGLVQQLQCLARGTTLTVGPPEPPRGPDRPPQPRERPVPPELGERLEQQGQAIRELNGAVNELRQQMAALQEMLQKLAPREREERR